MKSKDIITLLRRQLERNQELLASTEEELATLDPTGWEHRVQTHLKGYYTGRVDELIVLINRVDPSKTLLEYPVWVCHPCGNRHGFKKCGVATWHENTCGICGQITSVTEPRDFGHLKNSWMEAIRNVLPH